MQKVKFIQKLTVIIFLLFITPCISLAENSANEKVVVQEAEQTLEKTNNVKKGFAGFVGVLCLLGVVYFLFSIGRNYLVGEKKTNENSSQASENSFYTPSTFDDAVNLFLKKMK